MALVALPRPALNGDTVWALDLLRDRLADAERRLGAPIQVRTADAGHRTYARQAYYRAEWKAGRGAFAADPDTGDRGHMRGSSIDIARTDAAAQAAMRAAGFLRDAAETWHWNVPQHTRYPIITTRPEGGITMSELINTKGSDGRNVLDSVIQTRRELRDRAREGAAEATGTMARRQEEINNRAEQRHAELLQAIRDLRPKA